VGETTGRVGRRRRRLRAGARGAGLAAILLASVGSAGSAGSAGAQSLAESLQRDDAIVTAYLESLGPGDLGQPLTGVHLGDGRLVLADHRFFGRLRHPARGSHVYRLRSGRGADRVDVHVIWIDADGEALTPECKGEWVRPGAFSVLSTDVYTWPSIRPGDGVVITRCRPARRAREGRGTP